jgi:hypothetical protein
MAPRTVRGPIASLSRWVSCKSWSKVSAGLAGQPMHGSCCWQAWRAQAGGRGTWVLRMQL